MESFLLFFSNVERLTLHRFRFLKKDLIFQIFILKNSLKFTIKNKIKKLILLILLIYNIEDMIDNRF